MIKRNNKKGFTIVELVIVIAVIAILAAVLIPTFAGIIKKANQSADMQLTKNLNTALAAYSAIEGAPEDAIEFMDALAESGYVIAKLNPAANNCWFAWDSENNQVLYMDKDFNVLYPEDVTPAANEKLYLVVSSAKVADGLTTSMNIVRAYVPDTYTSDATINEVVHIGKTDFTDLGYDAVRVDNGANVTITGGTYHGGSGATNSAVWAKGDATVTIKDGYFSTGVDQNGEGNPVIYAGYKNSNASIIIEGGFFETEAKYNNNYWVLNCDDLSPSSTITVKGGTFVNFNPADCDYVGEGEIIVADGYKVVDEKQANGDVWYTVVAK